MTLPPSVPLIINDVWSRTAAKYRTRAVILLIANAVLFGALCCFMFWLRTGWYFPPTDQGYAEIFKATLNIAGAGQVTLYDLFNQPISLKLVPMQAVVIGLLIASLVSIPILISILYRFPASVPFCVMVAVLAVMPWLGATLLLSCAITAYSRKKLKFRFVAAILGLVPIGVYFFTASQRYAAPVDVLTPQIERGLLIAPLLLSALASCSLIAVTLTIARVVDYRPGAIAPLLAVMFLAPCVLFLADVGRDELHYRFLESRFGPQSTEFFANADANPAIRAVARNLWHERPEPKPTLDVFERRVKLFFEQELRPTEEIRIAAAVQHELLNHVTEFAREQHRVAAACDKFLRDFPRSRYIPCVLFLKGRALDMRVDVGLFRERGLLRFYDDFPNEASRGTWNALSENFPESPLTDVANYRLAQLDARAGHIDLAIRRLARIADPAPVAATGQPLPRGNASLEAMLAKKPPEASLQDEYVECPVQAAQLLSMFRSNREPTNGDAALVAFLDCDPRHPNYQQNLREILERFSPCKIRDNIEVQIGLLQSGAAEQLDALARTRQRHPQGDALPQLIYEMAMNRLRQGQYAEAAALLQELIDRHGASTFAMRARRMMPLTSLSGRTQRPQEP